MNALMRVRLPPLFLLVLLMTGCASTDTVRGRLDYDLRPEGERTAAFWPPPPDTPRYRYVGELVGEPNFLPMDKSGVTLETAFKWLVGLFETKEHLMLVRPQHGAVGDNGRIYVVDAGRKALLVFDPNPPPGEKSRKAEGQLLVWDVLDATTRLSAPAAVTIAWDGEIAVSDVNLGAVLRLNDKGELIGKLGIGELKRPTGLAFDRERGLLYVADTAAHDIKVYDAERRLVNVIGAPGERTGELNAPTYLAVSQGLLYVSDSLNSRIQVFDSEGRHLRAFGERGLYLGNLARPKGVTTDEAGIVYVVESYYSHLLAFNEKDELLLGISGNALKGDKFFLPSGVWTDRQGRVFVADMFNGRVVIFQFLGGKTTDVHKDS